MGSNGINPVDQWREGQKCPDSPTKKRFRNSDEAWEAARLRSEETGLQIVAYLCAGCGGAHLSRKVKGSDVAVKAPVGITTGALRKKVGTFLQAPSALSERRELPQTEGPIMPGNAAARRKMLAKFLEGRDSVTTAEIMVGIGTSRHSVARYMGEIGWTIGRGPGARWRPAPKLEALPTVDAEDSELAAAIARHPSSRTSQDWWTIDSFPSGVSVHDYLLTLKTAGLIVEVRVRRAP